MPRIARFLSACTLTAALAVAAPAAPTTQALDAFSADLAAEAALRDPPDGSVAKRELAAIRAVQSIVEKRRSASLADDVRTFRDGLRRLTPAFGSDGRLLLDGLASVRAAVQAEADDARADADVAFEGIVSRQVTDILGNADLRIADSLDDQDGRRPAWKRAESLRRAAATIAAARRAAARTSRCTARTHGRMVATIGSTDVRLGTALSTRVTDRATGQFHSLVLSSYDRTRGVDPYRNGRLEVTFYAPAFQGAGSYDLAGDDAVVEWRYRGEMWVSESGTIDVTSWDVAQRRIVGTFSGTIRNLESSLALTVTDGKFAFCTWDDTTISQAAK